MPRKTQPAKRPKRQVVSPVDESFQVVPALRPPRTWKEIEEIAHEEIAQNAGDEASPNHPAQTSRLRSTL